jgi:predicted restriction endonuclease
MRNYPPRAPQNPAGHWTARRDRATQARFATRVLHNAGHQCQFIHGIGGHRCLATTDLQAHHTIPGNDDPNTGVALCRLHHRTVDNHAR